MSPRAESPGLVARITIATAVLLVLLAVVAIASRSGLGAGGGAPEADNELLDRLFTGLLVLLLLYIPFAAWIYWSQRELIKAELGRRRRRPTILSLLSVGAVFLAAFLAVRVRPDIFRRLGLDRAQPPAGAGTAPTTSRTPTHPYEPRFDWVVAVMILGIVLAALATVAIAMRRRAAPERDELDIAAELSRALTDSLDDILAEGDPRRAVIVAYSRMERALTAAGVPRAAHETPFEYVGRALCALDVGEPSVRRLTELFERARFSTHAIDETMRSEAIGALVQVREELLAQAA